MTTLSPEAQAQVDALRGLAAAFEEVVTDLRTPRHLLPGLALGALVTEQTANAIENGTAQNPKGPWPS